MATLGDSETGVSSAATQSLSEFRVLTKEIPQEMTFVLSENERCMLADLLTRFGIKVGVAGDTFHHLYRKGLERVYADLFQEGE